MNTTTQRPLIDLRSEKGISLMEVAFSLAIFCVVVVTAVFTLFSAHQLSVQSRDRLMALTAARSTLEAIKDTPLTALDTINANLFIPRNAANQMLLPNGNVQILSVPALAAIDGNTVFADITVRVTWIGAANRAYTLDVSTRRSRF